jgi:predicted neutral ceramidase superfamily lipid hydrolase
VNFCPKFLPKIFAQNFFAQNFSPLNSYLLWHFFPIALLYHIVCYFFQEKTVVVLFSLTKYGLGYVLGDFFKKASGHPAQSNNSLDSAGKLFKDLRKEMK